MRTMTISIEEVRGESALEITRVFCLDAIHAEATDHGKMLWNEIREMERQLNANEIPEQPKGGNPTYNISEDSPGLAKIAGSAVGSDVPSEIRPKPTVDGQAPDHRGRE